MRNLLTGERSPIAKEMPDAFITFALSMRRKCWDNRRTVTHGPLFKCLRHRHIITYEARICLSKSRCPSVQFANSPSALCSALSLPCRTLSRPSAAALSQAAVVPPAATWPDTTGVRRAGNWGAPPAQRPVNTAGRPSLHRLLTRRPPIPAHIGRRRRISQHMGEITQR